MTDQYLDDARGALGVICADARSAIERGFAHVSNSTDEGLVTPTRFGGEVVDFDRLPQRHWNHYYFPPPSTIGAHIFDVRDALPIASLIVIMADQQAKNDLNSGYDAFFWRRPPEFELGRYADGTYFLRVGMRFSTGKKI